MILLLLILASVSIFSFIDACIQPNNKWVLAGQSKALWIVLILLFGVLAGIPYLIWIRPMLEQNK